MSSKYERELTRKKWKGGGGGITYPTVLAGWLTGHTWPDTGSFARCHLNRKKNNISPDKGVEWNFFLPSGSAGCLRLWLFLRFEGIFMFL